MDNTAPRDNQFPFTELAAQRLGISNEELERLIDEYMDLQVMYRSAIREISARLEILDDEFQFRHRRNPIHNIQTRLKSPRSMMEKLGRRNIAPSIESLRTELTDIAGVRVICSYVDDIYLLADLLCQQDDVELVRMHDYIRRPKPSGYRSLHMVVKVPVHFSTGKQMVPVEIQIRTIAMDFWASLEHELRYKALSKINRDIVRELRDCSDNIAETDVRMQRVYRTLEAMEDARGEGPRREPEPGEPGPGEPKPNEPGPNEPEPNEPKLNEPKPNEPEPGVRARTAKEEA